MKPNLVNLNFEISQMSSSFLSRLAALQKAVPSAATITDDAITPSNALCNDKLAESINNDNQSNGNNDNDNGDSNESEWFKPSNHGNNKSGDEPTSATKNKESLGSHDTDVKVTTYARLV